MTDLALIQKKLAFIETCIRQLRTDADVERIAQDVREERYVEHTLQLAIQAALDVASHLVSERRLGEPRTNRELFDLIAGDGWIGPETVDGLRDMAGFRNVVVHGYMAVDLDVVRDVMQNGLSDLETFIAHVRSHLTSEDGEG